MRKVRKELWNVLSVLVVLMMISMIGSWLLTGWSSIFSYRVFYIMSESMEPEIKEHQLVVGKVVSKDDELRVGEIYAYRREGIIGTEIVIHRLSAVMEDGKYQFKGDYNEFPDEELVEREDIGYLLIIY